MGSSQRTLMSAVGTAASTALVAASSSGPAPSQILDSSMRNVVFLLLFQHPTQAIRGICARSERERFCIASLYRFRKKETRNRSFFLFAWFASHHTYKMCCVVKPGEMLGT